MIGVLVLSSLAWAESAATRTSLAGFTFTQVVNQPALGDAWADPSGLVWGDVVEKSRLTPTQVAAYCQNPAGNNLAECLMDQKTAIAYCLSIGARLPSNNEFAQLDRYLGDSNTTMDINGNFLYGETKTEVVPRLARQVYWSATPNQDVPDVIGYVFNYGADAALEVSDNDVISDYLGSIDSARCVASK